MDLFNIRDDEALSEKVFALKGAKFGFCKSPVWPKAGAGTQNAMDKAAQILKHHGAGQCIDGSCSHAVR